jgi:hypothetical protein
VRLDRGGVVDQHVEPAEPGRGVGDEAGDRVCVGQVALHDDVAVPVEHPDGLHRERGGVAVVHRHPVSGGGEGHRDRPPDASRGTRHQHRPTSHAGTVAGAQL